MIQRLSRSQFNVEQLTNENRTISGINREVLFVFQLTSRFECKTIVSTTKLLNELYVSPSC